MGISRRISRPVSGLMVAAGLLLSSAAAQAAEISWNDQITFERTSVDEDLRDVLRSVLQQNGLQVIFRPGVKGNVTFSFKNIPLQAAFNKLIEENGLAVDFDETTRTVTISPPGPGRAEELITLNYAQPLQLRTAAHNLNLGGEVVIDADNDIVLARGTPEQVRRLAQLAERLDKAEEARIRRQADGLEGQSRLAESDAKRRDVEATAATRELENRKLQTEAEIKARLRDDLLNSQIETIRLRYANVGSTTQTFQGQNVTFPGVDETLRTMLGLDDSADKGVTADTKAKIEQIRQELGMVPPLISTDVRTNSIIVRGTPKGIDEVRGLVQRLDRPLPLIEIEVMIVRAQRGVSEELGIRWGAARVGNTRGTGRYGGAASTGIGESELTPPFSALPALTTKTTTNDVTNVTTTETEVRDPLNPITLLPTALGGSIASFIYQGTNWALQTQLNALSQADRTQTLSAPRVVTLNNIPAKITNDRSRFLPTPPGPNAAGDLREIRAGLSLNITPSLIAREDTGEEGLIRLSINAADKDVVIQQGIPSLTGNEVQTQVVIPNGATFVMGGLMSDFRGEGTEKVPGLGDIPLLGGLFKNRSSIESLAETIFFITPRVLEPGDLFAQDIAQRRYLQNQRSKLSDTRRDLQDTSQLLSLQTPALEEDE